MVLLVGGVRAVQSTPLDAVPDMTDTQVIVRTEFPGQSPQLVEDLVTYPMASALLGLPRTEDVRGVSMFGSSFIYVVFEDGVDQYWARSRVLEALSRMQAELPAGATPELGPDATGVGWVYQYALVDRTGQRDLADLRALQDWFLRFELAAVDGVAEVASVGGFQREFQVLLDPDRLRAFGVALPEVIEAVRRSSLEASGSIVEQAETEFFVRARGYVTTAGELEQVSLYAEDGAPVTVADLGRVIEGPALRRGVTELNGEGEVVSGIIVMRDGENALEVIDRVTERIDELSAGLPEGVEIVPVYDRAPLIEGAVEYLQHKLIEEAIAVTLVVLIFLLHVRSAFVSVITLPLGVLAAFIVMQAQGVTANIMSLGGIAIAIGAMVDASIVMVENANRRLADLPPDASKADRDAARIKAVQEVGPGVFFSLLIITVSFLPVFALTGESFRLFSPLAFTKTYAMAFAAALSVTLVPVLIMLLVRGRVRPERANPIMGSSSPVIGRAAPGAAVPLDNARADRGAAREFRASARPARRRVHAAALRGRTPVHADDPARRLDGRVARHSLYYEPADHDGSRSRTGLRQGRAGRHGDRSRAHVHDRDLDTPQATRAMAAGPHAGSPDRGVERARRHAGACQFLGLPDQDPHGHDFNRRAYAGGCKDHRRRLVRNRTGRRRCCPCGGRRGRRAFCVR